MKIQDTRTEPDSMRFWNVAENIVTLFPTLRSSRGAKKVPGISTKKKSPGAPGEERRGIFGRWLWPEKGLQGGREGPMFLEDKALHKKQLQQLPSDGISNSGSHHSSVFSIFVAWGYESPFFIGVSRICAVSG